MNENTHTLSEVLKVYTLETTPEYFGAYLNIARHNVFMISQEMSRKFNPNKKDPAQEDGQIGQSFLTESLAPTDSGDFIYQNLCRYLPLANAFSSDFRNEYTHYFSKNTGTHRKVHIEDELAI